MPALACQSSRHIRAEALPSGWLRLTSPNLPSHKFHATLNWSLTARAPCVAVAIRSARRHRYMHARTIDAQCSSRMVGVSFATVAGSGGFYVDSGGHASSSSIAPDEMMPNKRAPSGWSDGDVIELLVVR